jgi:hypothetical protein
MELEFDHFQEGFLFNRAQKLVLPELTNDCKHLFILYFTQLDPGLDLVTVTL